MEWTPRYSIGVKAIDEQHQELFRRIDRLDAAMRTGNRDEVTELLAFLGTYVVQHFGDEEREMVATGYPLHFLHKATHDRFVAQFLEIKRDFDASGATAWLSIRVHKVVTQWLKQHILGMDQELGKFLLARQPTPVTAPG